MQSQNPRWASTLDAEGFFVLYELEGYETLTSKGYLDRNYSPPCQCKKLIQISYIAERRNFE